jgi:hypothetical protein
MSMVSLLLAALPKEASFKTSSSSRSRSETLQYEPYNHVSNKKYIHIANQILRDWFAHSADALTILMLQVLWPSPYSFLATSSIPKLIYQAPMTELTKTLFQNLINRLKPENRRTKI